jgi:hypothetical protein
MTLEASQLAPEPARAIATEYTVLVTDELDVVLNDAYPHPSARRDAVIDLLLANHDEVEQHEVDEILAPFGGANADAALNEVVNLFVERGTGITVTVGERERDLGPMTIYTAFTDYGDGSYWVEHYPTREARLAELRDRAGALSESHASFEDADDETCRRAIDGELSKTRGRVILIEAIRHSVDESWAGQFPDDETV